MLIFILLTLFSQYILEDPILAPTEHLIAVRDLTPVSVCCLLHAQHAVSIISKPTLKTRALPLKAVQGQNACEEAMLVN